MSEPDLIERLRQRRVTHWVHSTGTPPKASGTKPDSDCQEAAAEIERLRAAINDALPFCLPFAYEALTAALQPATRSNDE